MQYHYHISAVSIQSDEGWKKECEILFLIYLNLVLRIYKKAI